MAKKDIPKSKLRQRPYTNPFLRAVGLQLLASTYSSLLRRFTSRFSKNVKTQVEPPKAVIQTSWRTALARCGVHIIPLLASAVVISLNYCGLYLGRSFPGLIDDMNTSTAVLQVVAKIQELLMVSSLGTLIFHLLRSFLLHGDGVPLGLLGSAFTFSQLSYFWSADYWAALTLATPVRWWIRASFGFLILICGVIAATAGPATALLLIPSTRDWVASQTTFYVAGNYQDLYPTRLSANSTGVGSLCNRTEASRLEICPIGGFSSLYDYMTGWNVRNFDNMAIPTAHVPWSQLARQVEFRALLTLFSNSFINGGLRGFRCQTSAVGSSTVVNMFHMQMWSDFMTAAGEVRWDWRQPWTFQASQYMYSFSSGGHTGARVPVVRTACSQAQNISIGQSTVDFPILPQDACWFSTKSFNTTLSHTPLSHVRTEWVQLPSSFGSTSTGLLFEAPWSQDNNSRIVVGCSIDARWADGWIGGGAGSPSVLDTTNDAWGGGGVDEGAFFRPPINSSSWFHIKLDPSWLNLLTPKIETAISNPNGTSLNALESILTASGLIDNNLTSSSSQTSYWNEFRMEGKNRTLILEWAIALLVTNGLSRHGSSLAVNMTSETDEWSILNYVKSSDFNLQILGYGNGNALIKPTGQFNSLGNGIVINGYAYKASTLVETLSIAVLCGHIFLALAHTLWIVCWTQRSSGCWDTITELLALSLNSTRPRSALRNTSAGIMRLSTFALRVQVRAIQPISDRKHVPVASGLSRVELIMPEDDPGESENAASFTTAEEDVSVVAPQTISNRSSWPLVRHKVNRGAEDNQRSTHSLDLPVTHQPLSKLQKSFRPAMNEAPSLLEEAHMNVPEKIQSNQIYG